MANQKVVIEFLGKDRSLGKTTDSLGGKSDKLGGRLKKFGAAAALGFGLAGVAAGKFAIDAVDSASDLNETLNKSNTIFGQQGPAIEKWAAGAAKAAGLSKQAALEAAASFGDMFTQIGFSGKEAAKMSKSTVQMSADLGSFNNLPTEDVAQRMSAAFRGEYDSLQALIPNINAARVEQQAMATTGKKNAKELTAQEKAAAVLAIVHKDGAKAQGDFAKTSGGLANQQKILKAQFENVQASIGQKLLPVVVKLSTWFLNVGIPAISNFSSQIRSKLGPVIEWVRGLFSSNTNGMASDVSRNLGAIKSTFQSVVSIVKSLWSAFGSTIVAFTTSYLTNLKNVIGGALQVISGIFKVFAALLKGDWAAAWNGIKQILSGAWQVIKALVAQGWNIIKTLFRAGGVAIRAVFSGIWSGIKSLASAGINSLMSLIRGVPGKLKGLASNFKSAGTSLIKSFVNGLSNAGSFISNISGNITKAVKGAINAGIDKINSALKISVNWPGPGSFNWQANIPHLATGGIVKGSRAGTPIVAGDGGHDEAIVPLSGPNAPKFGGGGGGGVTIIVNGALDPDAVANQIRQMLLKLKRTNGGELGIA